MHSGDFERLTNTQSMLLMSNLKNYHVGLWLAKKECFLTLKNIMIMSIKKKKQISLNILIWKFV